VGSLLDEMVSCTGVVDRGRRVEVAAAWAGRARVVRGSGVGRSERSSATMLRGRSGRDRATACGLSGRGSVTESDLMR